MVVPPSAARADPRRARRRRGRARCCAPASPPSTRCATAARGRATSSPCSGIGGLGHLGVQFAAKMGFRTVAIARGAGQGAARPQARRARLHRQPGRRTPRRELHEAGRRRGGPGHRHQRRGDERRASAGSASRHAAGRSARRPSRSRSRRCRCSSAQRVVQGWYSGTSIDSQDTLAFSALTGVRPMNEIVPARARRRSLRAHDERQGAVPRRPHGRGLTRRRCSVPATSCRRSQC